MNKNKLKDDIKNALTDLKDDFTTYSERYEDINDIKSNRIDLPTSSLLTDTNISSKDKKDSLEKHFSKTELEKMGIQKRSTKSHDRKALGYAVFKMLFPHIAGFVIGCAFARLLTFGFIGYVIMGIIFAFLVGLHKSTYNDQISLKYAVIKNIVLMLIEIAIILLIAGIYGIIYIMG